jgi:glutamate synthase (NADPH/NADH) large chain
MGHKPVPLDEVELRFKEIVKRFCTGRDELRLHLAPRVHETLAVAMNRLGGKSNTGEGGEDYGRFKHRCPTATPSAPPSSRSPPAASASPAMVPHQRRRNSRSRWPRAPSPAKGGELARRQGVDKRHRLGPCDTRRPASCLISPPPHHDIYSIEDLAQLIYDLKNCQPQGRADQRQAGVGGGRRHRSPRASPRPMPTTSSSPVDERRHRRLPADRASSTPACPGSWASPRRTRPWSSTASAARVRLQTDGQLKTGRDVVIACHARGRGVRLRHRPAHLPWAAS